MTVGTTVTCTFSWRQLGETLGSCYIIKGS